MVADTARPTDGELEPTGSFKNGPNVTDKKHPHNPIRPYRSSATLRVIGESTDWTRQTREAVQA
jgi:hypothetical protein